MDLNLIQKKLFKLIPQATDVIDDKFDFKKNIAIELQVGDSISDEIVNNDISLQVRIVGLKKRKIDIQNKAEELDKRLNKTEIENSWIVRNNVYYSSYYDEDKFNAVLQYTIKEY